MRISDWSSDVCSSVLDDARAVARQLERERAPDASPRSRNKGNLARQSAHVLLHSKLIWSVDPDDGFAIDRRDALVGHRAHREPRAAAARILENLGDLTGRGHRSEEHTSELQSLMRNSYAVFCLKKKKNHTNDTT